MKHIFQQNLEVLKKQKFSDREIADLDSKDKDVRR